MQPVNAAAQAAGHSSFARLIAMSETLVISHTAPPAFGSKESAHRGVGRMTWFDRPTISGVFVSQATPPTGRPSTPLILSTQESSREPTLA